MKLFNKTVLRYISVTLIGMGLIFFAEYLGVFEGINNYLYDLSFRIRGPLEHDRQIIIAAIDEKTLKKLGRWPLRRIEYAKLLTIVDQAKVVGFDIIMAEPSEDDAVFADAVTRVGKVVLPLYIDSRLNVAFPVELLHPHGIGHVHVEQGIDGIVRKIFHTIYNKDVILHSFTSVMYETITGKTLNREGKNTVSQADTTDKKITQTGQKNINYYGASGTFQHISLTDILDGGYPESFFRDKIILVGLTTAGLEDKMLTPFTQKRDRVSGVEVHANILNNLIDKNDIHAVSDWMQWILVIVFSAACFLFFLRMNEKKATFFWLLCLLIISLSVFALFALFNIWFSPMVLYISLTYIFVVTYIFRLEKIGKLLFFAKKEWENTFNDISDAIIVLDSDFNVVRSNKAAGAILKRPVFETITTNWKDHLNVTASQRKENQSQSASVMTEPLLSEIFEQDLNRFLEIKSIPRLDKSKHVAGAIHLVRDITNRKQAEEKIRVHLEYLRALRNIDLSITSSLDLQITLNVLLEEVIAQLHVDAVDVLLIESKSSILGHALGKGFRNDTVQRMPLRVGEGYAGQVAFERKPLFIPDLLQKNLANIYTTLVEKEGFKTYFGMPLIAKGRVNGVLEIFHRTHFEPDAEWIDFLEGLTGQAAIAIDNAVMFVDLEHSRDEILIAYDSTIEGWSRALDFRDRDTERHSERVTEMAVKIGRVLKISEEELVHMRRGAFLHDIGKIGVPDSILLKAGSFTEEEWKVMKKHPNIAYEILSPIAFLRPALDIPYCHHEKWDGTGYPRGLKGEEIPLAARIFAVADVWDAMCSDRPNRPKWSKEYVKEHIHSLSGTHFDPRIVDTFFSIMWD